MVDKTINQRNFQINRSTFTEDLIQVSLDEISRKITDIDHKMPKKTSSGIPFLSVSYLIKNKSINLEIDHNNENLEYISKDDFDYHSKKI